MDKKQAGTLLTLASCVFAANAFADVRINNYEGYFDKETQQQISTLSGEQLKYQEKIDDYNDMLYALKNHNSDYDLIAFAGAMIKNQIVAGTVQSLDRSKIPNLRNINHIIASKLETSDPGLKYFIPTNYGLVALAYNSAKVKEAIGLSEINSWSQILDPKNMAKLASCGVYFIDAAVDLIPMVLKYLGKDPTSTNPRDYIGLGNYLSTIKPYVKEVSGFDHGDKLLDGKGCITIGYSGYLAPALQNPDVKITIPQEGSRLWIDGFVIPKSNKNLDATYKVVNAILDDKIAAQTSNFSKFATVVDTAKPNVRKDLLEDKNTYITDKDLQNSFVVREFAVVQSLIDRQWAIFKSKTK